MVDMHVHSWWSDGDRSIKELVQMAEEKGIQGIVICDHDTFSGASEVKETAFETGYPVFLGIEISCMDPVSRKQVHILGSGLDEAGQRKIDAYCRPIRESMQSAVKKSIEALENAGYPVTVPEVEALAGPGGGIYKQMVMEILIQKGRCKELYGSLYKELFKTGRDGQPPIARLTPQYGDPVETVRQIRMAGGAPVLAHPGQYDNLDLVPALVQGGLLGIEAYHPKNDVEELKRAVELAEQYGLQMTGGSDFHGRFGEGEVLGQDWVLPMPF